MAKYCFENFLYIGPDGVKYKIYIHLCINIRSFVFSFLTIFMSLECSCLRICNVDDAKVIDRVCTCSKLIFQPVSNKHCTKMRTQKHTA